MNNTPIFDPEMIPETRGRKSTIKIDFSQGMKWEFPAEQANTARVLLTRFKKKFAPLWKFRTWIADGKIYIVRTK